MDKETLKYVLAQSTNRPLTATSPRTAELPLDSRKVVTLIGIRRSGKTFLLYETMRRLKAQGMDRRQMLYLNFEDDRLLPIQQGDTAFPFTTAPAATDAIHSARVQKADRRVLTWVGKLSSQWRVGLPADVLNASDAVALTTCDNCPR